MGEPAKEKRALRADLRQRLLSLDPQRLHEQSVQASKRLAETEEFERARALMIFLPLRYEIDATTLAIRAWQQGKTVTVPLVSYSQKHMIPTLIKSLDEPMDADRHGVRTPNRGEPYPIDLIDMVVVPGLGFDRQGRRIGRGGGFYDRFLAQKAFGGRACGLAMHQQLVDEVPTNGHDVTLDMLATDEQVLRFGRARA